MRPLEIAFGVAMLVALIDLLRVSRARRALAFSVAGLCLVQLAVEGERWQLWPAYGLAALLLAHSLRRDPARRAAGAVAGLVLLVPSVGVAWLLPVPHLPEPSGSFSIGRRTHHLVDSVRERELMVTVWYPAQPGRGERAACIPFLSAFARDAVAFARDARARGLLPGWLRPHPVLLSHLRHCRSRAVSNARPDTGPHPLLVYSHGIMSMRAQNSALLQELASHGYVVAAVQHTSMSTGTVFPGGRRAPVSRGLIEMSSLDDTTRLQSEWLEIWMADARFVLSRVLAMDDYPVDAARVGVLGHSFGGSTALLVTARDPRVRAGIDLDGALWEATLAAQPGKPFLILAGERGEMGERIAPTPPEQLAMLGTTRQLMEARNVALRRRQLDFMRRAGITWLEVGAAHHGDFTDLPFAARGSSGIGDPVRMHRLIGDHVLAFLARHVRGDEDAGLDAVSARYPEVRELLGR